MTCLGFQARRARRFLARQIVYYCWEDSSGYWSTPVPSRLQKTKKGGSKEGSGSTRCHMLRIPPWRVVSVQSQSWFSGRGWGQQLFSFQSPAVHWMARISSLNCLSCGNPYTKPFIHWIASPLSLKTPFFFSLKTLRAKGTLISEPRFSTPCEMRFFPREKRKTTFFKEKIFEKCRFVASPSQKNSALTKLSAIWKALSLAVIWGACGSVWPTCWTLLCDLVSTYFDLSRPWRP